MKILIFAVGRIKERYLQEGVQEYLGRLRHYFPTEIVELRADSDLAKQLPPRTRLVILDEAGQSITSVGLSQKMAETMQRGIPSLAFLIGGADGISSAVKQQGELILSLSALTLPHRLVRLILLEQLYRAATILRNEPYHRE